MPETIQVSVTLPADPARIFQAWMDSEQHGWMTGGEATIMPNVGGPFSAWDGYITGTTLELHPFRQIVQTWRASDFPPDAPESRIDVQLQRTDSGTVLTLTHSNLPDGTGEQYRSGWVEAYFRPMQQYFGTLNEVPGVGPE